MTSPPSVNLSFLDPSLSQKSTFHPDWLPFLSTPWRHTLTTAMAYDGVLHLSHPLMIIASLFFVPTLLNEPLRLSFLQKPNFISSPSELFKTFETDISSTARCHFTPSHSTLFRLSKWDASTHAFLTRVEGCACCKFPLCVYCLVHVSAAHTST